ncbi:hypothetical protein MMC08_002989 [Hypocenomyce scalaris]|nr:hypothetical protein [Hypocenomyce scalaris]
MGGRIRHIKCDEQKPICVKCSSTGIVCDGYAIKQTSSVESTKDSQVTRSSTSVIVRAPSTGVVGDDQECRGFDFFLHRTAPELVESLQSKLWDHLVLQVSHLDSAVRHAVIAIGSLNERLYINNILTSDNSQANARHEFARVQYDKAMRQLRKRLSSGKEHPVEFTLISCFLFIIFEFLQGNDVAAEAHLRSGLDILRRSYAEEAGLASKGLTVSSSARDGFLHDIRNAFGVADMMATRWLDLSSLYLQKMPPLAEGPRSSSFLSERFSSLVDAELTLLDQMGQMYYLQRWIAAHNTLESSDQVPRAAIARQQDLIARLDHWQLAMGVLLKRIRAELSSEDMHRVTILSIKHQTAKIMLAASLDPTEKTTYQQSDFLFTHVVTLAESLLRPVNLMVNSNLWQQPFYVMVSHDPLLFNFTGCVIQALYFTAIKCCNRSTCRKALSLLSSEPWREGAFDSTVMVKVAERKILFTFSISFLLILQHK